MVEREKEKVSMYKIANLPSKLMCFFEIILVIQVVYFSLPAEQLLAESFTDDFTDKSKIASQKGLIIDTNAGEVRLARYETLITEEDTLLLSHLDSDEDITNPAVGYAGTVKGVKYDFGHDGNAVTITDGSTLSFPTNGNIDSEAGSISFWAKVSDWNENVVFYSDSGNYGYLYGYQAKGTDRIDWRFWIGWSNCYVAGGRAIDSWKANSWHNFVFSWDSTIGVVAVTIDGSTRTNYYDPFKVSLSNNILLGYSVSKGLPVYSQDVTIDELRITHKLYGQVSYDSAPRILESVSFDSQVENPKWETIEWDEDLPGKTDIKIQTNVSSNSKTWDGWLPKGMVSFTFDDGYKSVYDNALPILQAYGFPGVVYVINNLVEAGENGNKFYMTISDLHALENTGWEVGGHSKTHETLTTLTDDKLIDEIGGSYQFLKDNGFNVRSMAYPHGNSNYNVRKIASDYFEFARGYPYSSSVFDYPIFGKYDLPWVSSYDGLSKLKEWVDYAETNKKWVIFTFHQVNPHDEPLEPLAEYVSTKDVNVVTISEGMDMLGYNGNGSSTKITSANKRFIKYRAVLFSYDGQNTPIISRVSISMESEKTYDVNNDGIVNIIDLVFVGKAIGASGNGNPADVNGDGVVDASDLTLLGSHLGEVINVKP